MNMLSVHLAHITKAGADRKERGMLRMRMLSVQLVHITMAGTD